MAMVRPRGGDFVYNKREQAMMLDDIACARAFGVDGVVFGCVRLDEDGQTVLDTELVKALVDAAKGERSEDAPLQVTFHMAFDVLGNDAQLSAIDELASLGQLSAIDELASLGVERILTHGGPAGTPILDNVERLRGLVAYASDRLIILPGGGITWQNADQVASLIGVHEVHGTKVVRF